MNSQSRLGLQQTHGTPARVRGTPKAPPKREGKLWATLGGSQSYNTVVTIGTSTTILEL